MGGSFKKVLNFQNRYKSSLHLKKASLNRRTMSIPLVIETHRHKEILLLLKLANFSKSYALNVVVIKKKLNLYNKRNDKQKDDNIHL